MNDALKDGYVLDESMSLSLEQVCNSMPGGFFIYKSYDDEELIYANESMLRIFGCDNFTEFRELTCNSFKGIVHPEDYERVSLSINDQIAHNPYRLDFVEYRIIRKDGSIRWVEDYGRHMVTEKYGGIFYVFIEDATERRKEHLAELERMTEELGFSQVSIEQFRKAVLSNAITFFEVNLTRDEFISAEMQSGGTGGSDLFDFSKINKATKYSEYAKYWAKHTDERGLDGYRTFFNADRLIECYNRGEINQVFESFAVDDQGRKRFFQYVILLGKNEYTDDIIALSMVNDITEASRKMKMFQDALSEANAETVAVQSFLKTFSRDIRTPLNSIMSFANMFDFNSDDADMREYCVERIKASSKELFDTVTNSMKKMDVDEVRSLGKTECDLSSLLDDMKKRVLPDVSMKHITLVLDKSGLIDRKVYTDEIALIEVIGQMLDNAVKYTAEEGTVLLRAVQHKGPDENTGSYRFEIADNSIEVKEDFVEKMNEFLERKPDDEDVNVNTEGWNLVVVRKFADLIGGTISVKTYPGKGGCFALEVDLPFVK